MCAFFQFCFIFFDLHWALVTPYHSLLAFDMFHSVPFCSVLFSSVGWMSMRSNGIENIWVVYKNWKLKDELPIVFRIVSYRMASTNFPSSHLIELHKYFKLCKLEKTTNICYLDNKRVRLCAIGTLSLKFNGSEMEKCELCNLGD